MASSSRPPGSGTQQAGSVSKSHSWWRPLRGMPAVERLAGMSHQYSAASSGCQKGDSPSSEGATGSAVQQVGVMPPLTSIFIQASIVACGASARRPCAVGSDMWMALGTWLTGSTQ
jgi:hypothetical protein